jgi:hypothetical protein
MGCAVLVSGFHVARHFVQSGPCGRIQVERLGKCLQFAKLRLILLGYLRTFFKDFDLCITANLETGIPVDGGRIPALNRKIRERLPIRDRNDIGKDIGDTSRTGFR